MQPQVSTQFGPVFFVFIALAVLLSVLLTVLTAVGSCKMAAKAGYSWALGLLMIVPFGNVILPLFLGFADWPVQKELRQLRQRCGGTPT